MFCQLGKIQFEGAKSFVTFSEEEEAVVVEHALISRKSKLQGTAIGLQSINITLFLHQEFCKVTEEIAKLRSAKNTFEILPLLWGNGQLEGNYVITSISQALTQMDNLGNTISATVSISLKESFTEDRQSQEQQQAQKQAFAVGDKNPPSKSNRINPVSCSRKVGDIMTIIKANAGAVDNYCLSYNNDSAANVKMVSHLNIIMQNCSNITNATPGACISEHPGFAGAAIDTRHFAGLLQITIKENTALFVKPVYVPNLEKIKSQNRDLQDSVRKLTTAANALLKSAITKK